jgi:hypothetical protein
MWGISFVAIRFYLLNYPKKKIHLRKEAIYRNTLDQFSTNNIPYEVSKAPITRGNIHHKQPSSK